MTTRSGVAAFTLIEILMVLALLGLMAGLFITSASSMVGEKSVLPEDLFWRGVTAARKQALLKGHEVRMTFLKATKEDAPVLALSSLAGEERISFAGQGDVTLDFLPAEKTRNALLLGGELVETKTVPTVTFYADGTCSPFRLQIRLKGAPRVLAIDPWTCAAVLPAAEGAR